jgi:hypothetical protein
VISNLTEKTLHAATTAARPRMLAKDDSSIESGHTSCSKTQAAVKAALKEVSLEHSKAMAEQEKKSEQKWRH